MVRKQKSKTIVKKQNIVQRAKSTPLCKKDAREENQDISFFESARPVLKQWDNYKNFLRHLLSDDTDGELPDEIC